MKPVRSFSIAIAIVGLVVAGVQAMHQEKAGAMKMSVVPQTPEWQKLKTLVGSWEGTMEEGGQTMPATVEVRMTGDGSTMCRRCSF